MAAAALLQQMLLQQLPHRPRRQAHWQQQQLQQQLMFVLRPATSTSRPVSGNGSSSSSGSGSISSCIFREQKRSPARKAACAMAANAASPLSRALPTSTPPLRLSSTPGYCSRTCKLSRKVPTAAHSVESTGPSCGAGSPSSSRRRRRRVRAVGSAVTAAVALEAAAVGRDSDVSVDVAVVGAGIVGLCVALELLLRDERLRVAVVDREQPCAGATGAGQGYLWLAHRSPAAASWPLALHSRRRWEHHVLPLLDAAAADADGGACADGSSIGWQKKGSLLFTTKASQQDALQQHVQRLQQAGVDVRVLQPAEVARVEPGLSLPDGSAVAIAHDDAQVDGKLAVARVLQVLRTRFKGRYVELFHEPVESLLWDGSGRRVAGVRTSSRTVTCPGGVVACAGAWSAPFLASAAAEAAAEAAEAGQDQGGSDSGGRARLKVPPVLPRKGHLVEVSVHGSSAKGAATLTSEQLPRHGLMEFEYTANYSANSSPPGGSSSSSSSSSGSSSRGASELSQSPPSAAAAAAAVAPGVVTMAATVDHLGRILIGSSRELVGYDVSTAAAVVRAMLERAALFLPHLHPYLEEAAAAVDAGGLDSSSGGGNGLEGVGVGVNVRVGLRPYLADGRPIIGAAPGLPGVVLACGHEGSGLTMAPGTADIVASLILGRAHESTSDDFNVNASAFECNGRLVDPSDLPPYLFTAD